jgi:hypothetical protein
MGRVMEQEKEKPLHKPMELWAHGKAAVSRYKVRTELPPYEVHPVLKKVAEIVYGWKFN